VYSFNKSRLVTVWAGFSTEWYGKLFANEQILQRLGWSLRIAALKCDRRHPARHLRGSRLGALQTVRGRTLLVTMTTAPVGDARSDHWVIATVAVRRAEQAIGWPAGRGMTTITIAHITLTLSYVTVVVQSRLVSLDVSLEEAAMDLGARPAESIALITLPIIAPALLSGWLLAFTISLMI